MTETELNRLRAKLRRLDINEAAINSCLHQFEADLETYVSASQVIDAWERPPDSSQTVLQALACGLIAAVLGGWFASVS